MKRTARRRGFTLVELSLSLAFIGVLSVTTVLIINNTVVAYQRGVLLGRINTVGMDLVDDMRSSVQSSSIALGDSCQGEGDGSTCVSFVYNGNTGARQDVPLYGGLCTGKYTYVWKSGYLQGDDNDIVKIKNNGDFRLVKFNDKERKICTEYMNMGDSGREGVDFVVDGDYEELLEGGSGLVLYDLHASMPAISTASGTAYYSVAFILGTKDGGADIKASGDYCMSSEGGKGNFDYCAINKFSFAAQAGGIK